MDSTEVHTSEKQMRCCADIHRYGCTQFSEFELILEFQKEHFLNMNMQGYVEENYLHKLLFYG